MVNLATFCSAELLPCGRRASADGRGRFRFCAEHRVEEGGLVIRGYVAAVVPDHHAAVALPDNPFRSEAGRADQDDIRQGVEVRFTAVTSKRLQKASAPGSAQVNTQTVTENATEVVVSAATATADQVVKYTVSVTFDGRTYTTETENITVPGTATGEPNDPTPDTPAQPAQNDNVCKWDNVDHGTSFWGRIVKFFHSILWFFAHLFRLR